MNMEKLEVIQKICEVILKFNNTETRKETTKNKPTFFFRFSGHVLLFEVRIYKNGYDRNDNCSDYRVFLDDEKDKLYDIYIEVLETISNYYKNL